MTPGEVIPKETSLTKDEFFRIKQGLSTKIKLNTLGENKQLAKELVSGKNSEFNTLDKAAKREVLNRLEISIKNAKADFATPVKPKDLASGGRIGMFAGLIAKGAKAGKAGQGKFTKLEVLIQRLTNTIKTDKDPYVQENFPKWIKELKAKPELAKDKNVWKNLTEDLDESQRLVVYSDDTVDFFRQTEFGPHNIENITKFQKEHPHLTRDQATKILNMEPEDRVLEMTRLEKMSRGQPHASGGLAYMLGEPTYSDGGRIGFSSGSTELTDFLQRLKEAKNGTGRYSDMPASQREMLVKSLTGQINVMLGKGHAEGGRIGFKEGNGAIGSAGDYALWKKAIKEGKISSGTSFWYFLELLETGGLQPPWTDKAEGGRIGFDKGKKVDLSKRKLKNIPKKE